MHNMADVVQDALRGIQRFLQSLAALGQVMPDPINSPSLFCLLVLGYFVLHGTATSTVTRISP
jgi:hypothetical protein